MGRGKRVVEDVVGWEVIVEGIVVGEELVVVVRLTGLSLRISEVALRAKVIT